MDQYDNKRTTRTPRRNLHQVQGNNGEEKQRLYRGRESHRYILQVPNESVDDACEDIINYAILAKAMLTEERELRGNLLARIEQKKLNK